jgi:hypothetical protein
MRDLDVELGEHALINVVRSTLTQRHPDSSTSDVLYSEANIEIASGTTVTIEGRYQDPNQSRSRIGAANHQALVAGTDYIFTADPDGAGTVLTGNLPDPIVSYGGSGFTATFTNPTGDPAGYLFLQVRGRVVRIDTPLTIEDRNADSIRARGLRPYDIHYQYLGSTDVARELAQLPLGFFTSPRVIPSSITFRPPFGSALEALVLPRSVGDMVAVGEVVSGLDPDVQWFFIHREQWILRSPGYIDVTFGLFPAYQAPP